MDCGMLRCDSRDDLRPCPSFRPIEFHRDREASGACERVPVELRRGRERRKRFVIMAAIVSDVRAHYLQERIDGRLERTPFGRKIVL